MVYIRRRPRRALRPRRMARRYRRTFGGRRLAIRNNPRVHAPKMFVGSFKLFDIIADPFGTHPDGYRRYALNVELGMHPLYDTLSGIYRQFCISSVKFDYRTVANSTDALLPASNMIYVEDKDSNAARSVAALLSQDNTRKYVSNRNFSAFVSKPRPDLWQADVLGAPIKTITPANQLHWLSSSNVASRGLQHLAGQLCVQDITGATGDTRQGELWCKMYILAKEQCLVGL